MTVMVHPGSLEGTMRAPPSKSLTHRALFASLLARGGTIVNPLLSRDTRASLDTMTTFGAKTVTTRREIALRGAPLRPGEVHAANSGTTLRFATGIASLCAGTTNLQGDASLNERPMQPLVDALQDLGAEASCQEGGTPPVTVTGPIEGGHARLPGDVSSQFISALLLAGAGAPDGVTVETTSPIASRPYIDLTQRALETIGATVREDPEGTFHVDASTLRPSRFVVPGDYSSAAFPLVAGAIAGGPVTVKGLAPDTHQGDAAITEHLERFGSTVTRNGDEVTVKAQHLESAHVDLADTPDLFPALAVLAAASHGTTVLEGAPHLRDKESDRIQAMVDGLKALGVEVTGTDDGARIEGASTIEGGRVSAAEDHRIQMAFLVLGLAAEEPVTVEGDPRVHETSYPGFLEAMRGLGARIGPTVEVTE